jgi:hypothetical protein
MKVGLVGESPHDTRSVQNLLSRMYPELEFNNLISNIHGSMLDHQHTKNKLRKEFEFSRPDIVIFIRDLDALITDRTQLAKRFEYFRDFRSVVNRKALYMLNIYEIEALILCDLKTFMAYYDCVCEEVGTPHETEEPKEFLKSIYKRYNEVHNPKLFEQLDYNILLERSKYFREFIIKFNKAIAN